MTECTRCSTPTNNTAVAGEAHRVENSENGVIWLCDGCLMEFDEWLGGSSDTWLMTDNGPSEADRERFREAMENDDE